MNLSSIQRNAGISLFHQWLSGHKNVTLCIRPVWEVSQSDPPIRSSIRKAWQTGFHLMKRLLKTSVGGADRLKEHLETTVPVFSHRGPLLCGFRIDDYRHIDNYELSSTTEWSTTPMFAVSHGHQVLAKRLLISRTYNSMLCKGQACSLTCSALHQEQFAVLTFNPITQPGEIWRLSTPF